MTLSEVAILPQSLDDRGVVGERLINVVGVRDVLGVMLSLRAEVTLSEDLLANRQVAAQHLGEEDVVDLDVMRREPVVEERRREHHVVAIEPELDTVLCIELHLVSSPCEAAPGEDHCSAPAVDPQASVIDWTIALTRVPQNMHF